MDILTETFQLLKDTNLVKTETEFSLHWLHKSERYYSMIKHSDRDPSVEALWSLLAHLREHGRQGETEHTDCKGQLAMTRLLEQRLETELHHMALVVRELH